MNPIGKFPSWLPRKFEGLVFSLFALIWTASLGGCQVAEPSDKVIAKYGGPPVEDSVHAKYGIQQPTDTLIAKYGAPVPVDSIVAKYGVVTPIDTIRVRYGIPTPRDSIKALYGISSDVSLDSDHSDRSRG